MMMIMVDGADERKDRSRTESRGRDTLHSLFTHSRRLRQYSECRARSHTFIQDGYHAKGLFGLMESGVGVVLVLEVDALCICRMMRRGERRGIGGVKGYST